MAHENGTKRNLSELFAHARTETPVVSRGDIDALLDDFDLHGRQEGSSASEQGATVDRTQPFRRGIVMGMISAVVIGAVIGAGSFIYSGGGETAQLRTTSATEQPVENRALADFSGLAIQMPITLPTSLTIAAPSVMKPVSSASHLNPMTPLVLQNDEADDRDEEVDRRDREMGEELGRFVTEFWDGKINQYRRAIDRAVSRADLADLNRLRVRWSLLEDEDRGPLNFQLNTMTAQAKGNGKSITNSMSLSNNGMKSFNFDARVDKDNDDHRNTWTSDGESDDVAFDIDTDEVLFLELDSKELGDDQEIAEEFINVTEMDDDGNLVQKIKVVRTVVDKSDVEVDSDGKKVEINIKEIEDHIKTAQKSAVIAIDHSNQMKGVVSSLNVGSMGNMLKMAITMDQSESSTILQATWEIAERSRTGLDPLKAQIMEDVTTFEKELKKRVRAIAKASDIEMDSGVDDDASLLSNSIANEVLGPLYDVIAEPMLMLYNGSDITPVLTSAIAPPVPGMVLEAQSTLSQSFPNPAQERATIEFHLDAPSNGTVLRLFDVTGSEVETRDLGTLPAGIHSEVIDVSNLPSGTYLYHLTVESPEGSRVYSKSLDVIN